MAKNRNNNSTTKSQENVNAIIQKPSDFLTPNVKKTSFTTRVKPYTKKALMETAKHTGYDYDDLLTQMLILYVEHFNAENPDNIIPVLIKK
jgi:hypothetical protein